MAGQFDPVEEALAQFGNLRGAITQQILTLPAPDPFREALMEMDRSLGKVEDDLVLTARKVSPLSMLDPLRHLYRERTLTLPGGGRVTGRSPWLERFGRPV